MEQYLSSRFIIIFSKVSFQHHFNVDVMFIYVCSGSFKLISFARVMFTNNNYHTFSSQQILEIQAIDKDTGNNARITYKIAADVNATEEYFKVQPSTGWVYLAKQLDRETTAKHKMIIIAVDNGIPPLSATANLVVNVIDANDNDPVFSKSVYEFQVEENQKAGAFVGKIAATDADLGDNAVVRYSLFPSNTSFNVNPITGELF